MNIIIKTLTVNALLLGTSLLLSAQSKQPNIVFLLSDDQSTYSVGCYGNSDVQTPQMDRLGAEGLIFDKHYVSTAICMASRATIFTGMYEYKTGTNFYHGNMQAEVWEKSYPVLLRGAGYLTAFAGKFGFEVEGKGLCAEDFDFWGGSPGQTHYETALNETMAKYAADYPHSTLSYGAFGQDVIKESVKLGKPFCLSISFKAPHKPATPDPRFDAIYAGKSFTKPDNFGREFSDHLAPQSKLDRQWARFSEWDYDSDYDGVMQIYHQQVYAIDVALGMIREELERQGVADNTVIIYTSDNGFLCGSHGYGSKVLPLEESSRVPLMIYDPRSTALPRQRRTRQLTCNIDFAPTILSLAGLPIPDNMDGHSLLPILENPDQGGHEQITLVNTWGSASLSVVTPRYKYNYWWQGGDDMEPFEEFFDLEKDPSEKVNLAKNPEYAQVFKKMQKAYADRVAMWQSDAVPYNDYERYGVLYDPEISLDAKDCASQKPKKQRRKK